MRYQQIKPTLLEYRRDKTAQTFGDKLLNRIGTSQPHNIPDFLYTVHSLIQIVKNPQNYSNWGTDHKRISLLNKIPILVGLDNAAQLLKQYKSDIVDATLAAIESGDPTSNKLYTPWLTREFINGNIKSMEDIGSRYTPLLSDYEQYKKKRDFPIEARDIMRLAATQFADIMGAYTPPEEEVKNKGASKTVYDDATARIIVPEDEAAACFYGQGTKWCTAATRGSNMFNHYNQQGKMYIILPKQPKYDGEKYQLHFPSEQFMNEEDEPNDLSYILNKRFPELKDFFIEAEPEIKNFVEFADGETLSGLGKLIGEFIRDVANDATDDWQHNDDSFSKWQEEQAIEKGYVDEDGEVDWDQVYEDDKLNDYGDYNYEYRDFFNNVYKVTELTPKEIQAYAKEMWEEGDIGDGDGTVSITDLEDVYAYAIRDIFNVGRRRDGGDAGISDVVSRRLYVRQLDGNGEYTTNASNTVLGKVGKWAVVITTPKKFK